MDCVDGSKERGFKTANVFVRIRPENVQEKKYKAAGNEKYLSDYTTKSLTVHKVRISLRMDLLGLDLGFGLVIKTKGN